ncbi:MAG: putative integral rane protein [Thermoleophilia bacterium]|nr:putative integral rane protein [Thermoleophilia bacterium]
MLSLAPPLLAASVTHTLAVVLHVVAIAAWLGTVLVFAIYGGRARVTRSAEASVALFRRLAVVNRAVALPGAFLALLAGGYLIHDAGQSVTDHWWIGTGIGAWIVCFFGSTMSRGSECVRIGTLAGEKGSDDEDVQWRIQRLVFLARGETLLLVVALVVMVVQPA